MTMETGREREGGSEEKKRCEIEKLVVTGFNRAGNSTNFIRVESSFRLESFWEGFINFN